MADKAFNLNSKFNIFSSFNISADDINTLSLLYAPLIGSDAFLLYIGYNSILERKSLSFSNFTHKELCELYSITQQTFLKARYKLEAVGLLISYVNDDGDYTYIICPPFTPKNYFMDAPLGLYLKSKISDKLFNYLYDLFKIEKIDKSNLKNVSKAFDDVFDSEVYNNITFDKFDYLLGKNYTDKLVIKSNKFDINKFIKNIDTSLIEIGVTDEFKKQINNLAYVYALNVDEMISIFNESIGKNCYFDMKIMKRKISIYFQYRRNMDSPKLVVKETESKEDIDLVNYLDNVSPHDLLDSMIPNYPLDYLSTINEIHSNINLPRGVLNCMIIKVLRDKSGELPKYKYFERVAESWIKDNVFSTLDAIKYVTTFKEKEQTQSKLKNNPIDLPNGGFDEL